MLPTRLLPSLLLALGVAGAFLTGCTPKFSQEDVDRSGISLAEVRALVESEKTDNVALFDARGPSAFEAGHIPGAREVSLNRFSGKHGETDPAIEKYDTIVVYADNPGSGSKDALALRMMSTGYDNVRTFIEGFDAWKRAGLPVEKSPTPETKKTSPDEPTKPADEPKKPN